ncbi:Aste57867_4779 [Aphanomyces stellatus]|uniref:Aste57867_4779 protein n=1 Tax=Aphanomyces stellatus TaxID=120398 RepID=A0A485KDM2_9STRA|nr:hypothetical protein As57867_004766 [Aphanomyces stellatus]VFT81874.1 Aste57867_4779 [Aphanomyces stellatus]
MADTKQETTKAITRPKNAAVAYDMAVLVAPPPMTIVAPRFVTKAPTTIIVKISDDYFVRDVNTGDALFHIQTKTDVYVTKTLVDLRANLPVAVILEPVMTGRHRQKVYKPDMTPWFDILPHMTFVTNAADCDVEDCVTGETHSFGIDGNALMRKAVVSRNGVTIARMHKPKAITSKTYIIDMAAGVDMALIVLFCLGMDEASNIHLLPVLSCMPCSF